MMEEHTEGGVEIAEAKIGEGRSVGEALEDAVEIAGVAEVHEAERRTGLALLTQETRLPVHLQLRRQGHQRPACCPSTPVEHALHSPRS